MLPEYVRKNIKELRLGAGMSVAEAAANAGISRCYWHHIESGLKSNPGTTILQRMAEAINCTIGDFFAQPVSSEAKTGTEGK